MTSLISRDGRQDQLTNGKFKIKKGLKLPGFSCGAARFKNLLCDDYSPFICSLTQGWETCRVMVLLGSMQGWTLEFHNELVKIEFGSRNSIGRHTNGSSPKIQTFGKDDRKVDCFPRCRVGRFPPLVPSTPSCRKITLNLHCSIIWGPTWWVLQAIYAWYSCLSFPYARASSHTSRSVATRVEFPDHFLQWEKTHRPKSPFQCPNLLYRVQSSHWSHGSHSALSIISCSLRSTPWSRQSSGQAVTMKTPSYGIGFPSGLLLSWF